MKESKFREFTKTDWHSYAGASNFEDGSSPLIAELFDGDITIIVLGGDNNDGKAYVELDYFDEHNDENYSYGSTYKFKCKEQAIKVDNLLINALNAFTEPSDISKEDIDVISETYGLKSLY